MMASGNVAQPSTDTSLNAELSVQHSLSESAQRQGRVHGVIIMVELGDLREGALPEELVDLLCEKDTRLSRR